MTRLTWTYLDDDPPDRANGRTWEDWAAQIEERLKPFDCLAQTPRVAPVPEPKGSTVGRNEPSGAQ